jgi:hypothetical protein
MSFSMRARVRVVGCEGHAAEIGVRDEDAHLDAQVLHRAGETLLLGDVAPAHAVVLERPEPLVRHELQLVDEVVARVVAEHAEVRGELQGERCAPGASGAHGAGARPG